MKKELKSKKKESLLVFYLLGILLVIAIIIIGGRYFASDISTNQSNFTQGNYSYIQGTYDGYNYRNAEQLNELTNYNMTFVYYNLNNQTFKIKLVPEVFCK